MPEQLVEKRMEETEIDLLDVFRKIIAIRKQLYKATLIGLVLGVVVGISIPKKYTVNVTLSPEMGNDKGSNGITGLAASFLGGSTGLSNSSDALNASLSSDIVSSTPFLLELLNMQVTHDKGETIILSEYLRGESSPWWDYIIGLPGMTVNGIKSILTNEEELPIEREGRIISLTKKENDLIIKLKKNIIAFIDKKTAITSVTVTLQNPKIAAAVADSVVYRLQEYIIDYRTSKAKEDCAYLEKLFEERKQEYYNAQKEYAEYVDTHDNLILQSVRAEQERLQNDMAIAYQVYSQVANQLQIARAKVQEEKPVFAVVEPAVVPLKAVGIGIKMFMLLFVFITVLFCILWELVGKQMWSKL